MEESEAEMSDSETEASDEEDDITSDISDTEGPVQAPASPRLENADSSFRHGALPPEDGVHPGTYGLDASSGEGLPREVTASQAISDPSSNPVATRHRAALMFTLPLPLILTLIRP